METEFNKVYREGLASSPWQHLDQTGARVGGVNYTTNIICNPLYTVYRTTRNQDRLSVLRVLQNTQELKLILNEFSYKLLGQLKLPLKWQKQLKLLPQETVLTQTQFNVLLMQQFSFAKAELERQQEEEKVRLAAREADRLSEKIVDVEIEKDEAVRELGQLIQESNRLF